ncbi:uroporphyrinogen-III C-methyltransferase [Corallincola luteus]|uniref:uroporphyrinogen-III C-methyltransferase n=1 Tax=Corallincola luteus TaxID=1775177 RepID=A0ABY2ARK5_9GAMM|nr:uroporphyrinogen-III C-methyltransferase [Corallincola luteus]TCI04746.1 uroporphyrinogen-III C-methyltransferase [Corallincola luteus]
MTERMAPLRQLAPNLAENMAQAWPPVPVSLIGAGPGDPGLLTIKALIRLQQADVVMYDYLVSEEIMSLVPAHVEKVCVGKRAGNHSVPQGEINLLMAERAVNGDKVVRLKGGDPFIYGRGGEELELLVEKGVPFEVVPGITAASGCAAYAGIPLTHRDYAQTAMFITGHRQQGGAELDWQILAKSSHTLVIYMGVLRSQDIQQALIAHGRDETTPFVIVERGTTPRQRVVKGQLYQLAEIVADAEVGSPALIIIGEVVALADKLAWFSEK